MEYVEKKPYAGSAVMTFNSEFPSSLRDKVKIHQDLMDESERRQRIKKQEPFKVHVATFPSVMVLSKAGAENLLVTRISGQYSTVLHKETIPMKGTIFKYIYNSFQKMATVDWNNQKSGKALTIKQIVDEIRQNSIPDIILDKLTVLMPWTRFNNNTLKNEVMLQPWTFSPYTFRKGTWARLKAIDFPAKQLYEEYLQTKRGLLENMSESIRKRWRDSLLMNAPHDDMTNQEIRSMWMGVDYALILKESRGNFDLMNIGEWKK